MALPKLAQTKPVVQTKPQTVSYQYRYLNKGSIFCVLTGL